MTRREEFEIIGKICDRAEEMGIVAPSANPANRRMNLVMDIDNAHKDVGLALEKLLEADDFNFAHDVIGIQHHMNRSTGKLEDFFVPRYAQKYHDVNAIIDKATAKAGERQNDGKEPEMGM